MKMKLGLVILLFGFSDSSGQASTDKYSIGGFIGYCYNLGIHGPKEKTPVSNVSFNHPVAKSFGFSFDLKPSNRYFIGLEFAYDEFDGGYTAEPRFQTNGISSGLLTTDERHALYKIGFRLGKSVTIFKNLSANFIASPAAGYSRYINEDTARENDFYTTGTWQEIKYIRFPRYQNTGLHFVIKATAELQYKFRNNMSVTLDVAYQQGFRPFVIDTVNIVRQYEPNMPQHKYWTRFSGTSMQFHIGMKYDF